MLGGSTLPTTHDGFLVALTQASVPEGEHSRGYLHLEEALTWAPVLGGSTHLGIPASGRSTLGLKCVAIEVNDAGGSEIPGVSTGPCVRLSLVSPVKGCVKSRKGGVGDGTPPGGNAVSPSTFNIPVQQ